MNSERLNKPQNILIIEILQGILLYKSLLLFLTQQNLEEHFELLWYMLGAIQTRWPKRRIFFFFLQKDHMNAHLFVRYWKSKPTDQQNKT